MQPPEEVHPDFDKTSPERLGQYADLVAEMDYRVGHFLDCIEQAGITDNTLVVGSTRSASNSSSSAAAVLCPIRTGMGRSRCGPVGGPARWVRESRCDCREERSAARRHL